MMEKIKRQLGDLLKGQDMLVYAFLVIVLTGVAFFGLGKVLMAYDQANEIHKQITTMKLYVDEYNKKAMELNAAPYRPVSTEQVDNVQSNILLSLQANQLELMGFKNIKSSEKNPTGQTFELEFLGLWPSTVHVIQNFHVRDALISIKDIKFVPEKGGKVKTSIQYKIYAK
jgi:hypothetical protein